MITGAALDKITPFYLISELISVAFDDQANKVVALEHEGPAF